MGGGLRGLSRRGRRSYLVKATTQLLADLMNSESAIDTYAQQLVFYALAMVEAEKQSRLKSV